MRTEYAETFIMKFQDPFTAYLHTLWADGHQDEEIGNSVDGPGAACRLGRHVVLEWPDGSVTRNKLEHPDEFHLWVSTNYPDITTWVDEEFDDGP